MAAQGAKTKKVFDGRYEILSIVGRGARSVVYRAKLISPPHSEVALKVLIDQKGKNTSTTERLRREALAMVSCRHRYVARLDDFHSLGTLCYLAMEYAPESDLRSFQKKNSGKLPVELAERFFKQAAEGLAFIHRAGIIHRDIKPENLLVMNQKEIRITDFGVALLPGEECSIADLQSGIGTMNYMAPEILEGKASDLRSDIYALGVVFYELLSGKNPFQGAPLARQIDIRKSEKYTPLNQVAPEVPQYLSDLITQCMRYERDSRFSSCDQLLTNLLNKKSDDFVETQKQKAKPTRPKTNNIHKKRRKTSEKSQAFTEQDETEKLFEEFDKLLAEEDVAQGSAKTVHSSADISDTEKSDPKNISTENSSQQSTPIASTSVEPLQKDDTDSSEYNEEIESNSQSAIQEDSDKTLHYSDEFETNSKEPQHSYAALDPIPQMQPRNMNPIVYLIASTVVFLFVIPALFNLASNLFPKLAFWRDTTHQLPGYEGERLAFPNLPTGVYAGQLEGLFPGKTVPLTLISFADQGKLAVLLGIEGWQPVVMDYPQESQEMNLKFSSHGLILDMRAEIKSGKISGFFKNVLNNSQGIWSAEPAV